MYEISIAIKNYLLGCLMEELSEVQQDINKCIRFSPDHSPAGYEGYGKETNIQRVQLEFADVQAILILLYQADVDTAIGIYAETQSEAFERRVNEKIARTVKLMETSVALGQLNSTDLKSFKAKLTDSGVEY